MDFIFPFLTAQSYKISKSKSASDANDKVNLIAMATDAAMAKGAHAGNLIKGIAGFVGGGGGGRPNMAQAGGKNPAGIPNAIAKAEEILAEQI